MPDCRISNCERGARSDRATMKIVIGLGNPGRKYEGTRHNVGFVVVEELARRHAAGSSKSNFQAEVSEASIGGEKVLLVAAADVHEPKRHDGGRDSRFLQVE